MGLVVASLLLAAVSSPAAAQWMWKDESGHVIASDQPPPPGTPQSRIMKEPRARPAGVTAAPASEPDQKAPGGPKSLADRELESKQRAKDAAEAAKKADEDAARAKALKENCAMARGNVAALQSGGRSARFNDKGEKVYIDDADRQNEIAKQQTQVSQFCNK